MSTINPYASPQTESTRAEQELGEHKVWSKGRLLVLKRERRVTVELPARCVKCNRAAVARFKQLRLDYHPPIVLVGLLLGPLVLILIAVVLRRRINVKAGLCEEHARIRRNSLLVGWLGSLPMIGLIFAAGVGGSDGLTALLFLSGIAGLIGLAFYASRKSRILWPKKIRKDLALLHGAGDEFLAELPEYPGKI